MSQKLVFQFKQFSCSHGSSSMKIGVDAVLLGAWAGDGNATNILDIGTGCGVITLMLAQRNPNAVITGIDIDEKSIEEATENFSSSPWKERLIAIRKDFNQIVTDNEKYDLIVSNPPYFDSGVKNPTTRREIARHQDSLSPTEIVKRSRDIMAEDGKLAIVIPSEQSNSLIEKAEKAGLKVLRILDIQGNPGKPTKRTLIEFVNTEKQISCSHDLLILESEPGKRTEQHISLCKDFYLKW